MRRCSDGMARTTDDAPLIARGVGLVASVGGHAVEPTILLHPPLILLHEYLLLILLRLLINLQHVLEILGVCTLVLFKITVAGFTPCPALICRILPTLDGGIALIRSIFPVCTG